MRNKNRQMPVFHNIKHFITIIIKEGAKQNRRGRNFIKCSCHVRITALPLSLKRQIALFYDIERPLLIFHIILCYIFADDADEDQLDPT